MTNIRNTFLQLRRIYVGGAVLFNHLKYNEVVWKGTHVSIFLMAVFDVLPGILEVLLDLRLPHKFSREQKNNYFSRLSKTTTSSAFKKYMGRMSFSRLSRYWLRDRDSSKMVRLYQTMQMQVVQPYAFTKIYCLTMLL